MKSKGFTLIELLVVVAIIGILATVVLSSLGSARGRARDAQLLSQAKEVQKAIEVYALDNNSYPQVTQWASSCSDANTTQQAEWNSLSSDLSDYITLTEGRAWPFCIMYRSSSISFCDGVSGYGYVLVIGTEESTFDYDTYSVGEGGSVERYCLYPL